MVERKRAEIDPGTVIDGRYEIRGLIGRGGMGEVYRARQVSLDTEVALKVLQRSLADDDLQVQRFSREAQACSRLRHPNSIRVIDFGRASDGHLYLAMELLEGRTLARVIRQEAPLDPQRVIRIAAQIVKSIGEAHDLGLVHRDLKPANIFLCDIPGESDFVKVLDFGIAKFLQAEGQAETLTQAGLIIGTPLYLAPEQATARPVTTRSDLYSLGVMMYHMVAGAPPFQADTPVALLMKHVTEPPPPLASRRPGLDVPPGLASLISDLLEKDPERRPESARVVGERLRRALVLSIPPAAPEPEEPGELALDDEDDEEDDLDLTGMGVDDGDDSPEPAPAKPPAPAALAQPTPVRPAPSKVPAPAPFAQPTPVSPMPSKVPVPSAPAQPTPVRPMPANAPAPSAPAQPTPAPAAQPAPTAPAQPKPVPTAVPAFSRGLLGAKAPAASAPRIPVAAPARPAVAPPAAPVAKAPAPVPPPALVAEPEPPPPQAAEPAPAPVKAAEPALAPAKVAAPTPVEATVPEPAPEPPPAPAPAPAKAVEPEPAPAPPEVDPPPVKITEPEPHAASTPPVAAAPLSPPAVPAPLAPAPAGLPKWVPIAVGLVVVLLLALLARARG